MLEKQAMMITVLMLPMILHGARLHGRYLKMSVASRRYRHIAPQPETQIVDVAWDGYCGSAKLTNLMGGPSDAGKLCACDGSKHWVMKNRNGYKHKTLPTIEQSAFFQKLARRDTWVLTGVLNGWDALEDLQLASIKCRMNGDVVEIWRGADFGVVDPRDVVEVPWDKCDEAPRATLFTREEKIHAQVLADDYCKKHHDPLVCTNSDCHMKSMRPTPSVELSTLEDELKQGQSGLVYELAPNGWPAFANLPARVTCSDGTQVVASEENSLWTKPADCRPRYVTLQLPAWMTRGWSPTSPGFVFRFQPKEVSLGGNAHIAVGTDILKQASKTRLVKQVYAFAHRYAPSAWSWKLHEKVRDILTYHAALLIEWVDTPYTTIIELAWQNGLGGYKGKSNWYHDKDAKGLTQLFRSMLDQAGTMVQPWHENRHEIRILDMPIASHEQFVEYVERYSKGKEIRFFDVHGLKNDKMASPALDGRDTEAALIDALLNFNKNSGGGYSEGELNCQTFQADLFSWLTGEDTHVFADQLMCPTALIMNYTKHLDWFETPS